MTAESIAALASSKEVLISTGSGGVGKTTTAAALAAIAATKLDAKVLVLTVDPARRLANALGMQQFGNREVQVSPEQFRAVGREPRGQLFAAMLDTKQSWDDLIVAHAPDQETANSILSNPLYNNITGKFVQSHDYVAMERLYAIHTSGNYDLVVVDTPPTRNAVDFLDAPERMSEFFSSRLLRWLIAPYRSRVINFASKPFYSIADRILGTQFLQDIAEFFILFQSMYEGFVDRANAVSRLLDSPITSFIVVSTLEAAPAREAQFFIDLLRQRKLSVGAVVLNKVLPDFFLNEDANDVARRLIAQAEPTAASLREIGDPHMLARMLGEIGQSFINFSVVAQRERMQRNELAQAATATARVPFFEHDIADLNGLLALGDVLWSQ